ncbi:MAG TPA: serine/threonine-protein kinase, partial [Myxococcota bacterium]
MLSGTTLDGFTVRAPLSCGGMGQTWLAQDANARDVVLKTVRPDLLDDEDVQLSFQREIDVTARLHHEHVVRHIAHGASDGIDFLALERIHGASLFDIMMARRRLPVAAAVRVVRDIASALDYVHAVRCADGAPLGLVHGDVSPQNILIDREGCSTLIDFGAAVVEGDPDDMPLIGKPGYMSPEQSRGASLDGRSDQYSLAIALWESLAGRSLFEGDARRRGVVVPELSSVASSVPASVNQAVARMLSFDREERFASCGDAVDAMMRDVSHNDADDRAWLAARARSCRAHVR